MGISTTMKNNRNEELQRIARGFLNRLRPIARKYGLTSWIDKTIYANEREECEATEKECELLARACDDDRITRQDVPKILGLSYRACCDNDIFDKLKTFRHVGIYSKISALLLSKKKNLLNKKM